MNIILATPFIEQMRGNRVTVERIATSLRKQKINVHVISSTDEKVAIPWNKADLYHGFNAYYFYQLQKRFKKKLSPYILTMTGTDLNHDLFSKERRKDVINALKDAKGIHVFNDDAKQILVNEVQHIEEKIYVIPQGVASFPEKPTPYLKKEEGTFLFLLPAGIRKVKNVPEGIRTLSRLREKYEHIRLWIMGSIIEEEEWQIVQRLVEKNKDWITFERDIPHDEMGEIYRQGDCILNTSFTEGQPSAIIEGLSFGLPAIVSDNEGNRSIVTHGETGFIYETEEDFYTYAEQLLLHPNLREEMGQKGKKYVETYHSAQKEVERFIQLYKIALSSKSEQ